MTSPHNPDDNWAELYRELGVEDSEPTTSTPPEEESAEEVIELMEPEEVVGPEEIRSEDTGTDDEEVGEEEFALEDAGADVAVAGTADEGEPGQRKRRPRRRRRKKKGGQPGAEAAAAGEVAGDEETAGTDAIETETQPEDGDDLLGAVVGPGVEDEASPEMTRDIIANWNVPSWEEIVAGLYRPER
jgi:hypothetical protein